MNSLITVGRVTSSTVIFKASWRFVNFSATPFICSPRASDSVAAVLPLSLSISALIAPPASINCIWNSSCASGESLVPSRFTSPAASFSGTVALSLFKTASFLSMVATKFVSPASVACILICSKIGANACVELATTFLAPWLLLILCATKFVVPSAFWAETSCWRFRDWTSKPFWRTWLSTPPSLSMLNLVLKSPSLLGSPKLSKNLALSSLLIVEINPSCLFWKVAPSAKPFPSFCPFKASIFSWPLPAAPGESACAKRSAPLSAFWRKEALKLSINWSRISFCFCKEFRFICSRSALSLIKDAVWAFAASICVSV